MDWWQYGITGTPETSQGSGAGCLAPNPRLLGVVLGKLLDLRLSGTLLNAGAIILIQGFVIVNQEVAHPC